MGFISWPSDLISQLGFLVVLLDISSHWTGYYFPATTTAFLIFCNSFFTDIYERYKVPTTVNVKITAFLNATCRLTVL
jgi:hypothetical protein